MGKLLNKYYFIITLLFVFVLYFKTLLPTVGFWDTGEFQTIGYTFDISHPTGYPIYIILLKLFTTLFPINSVAWRANIFSTLVVVFGLYFFSKSIKILTNKWVLAATLPLFLATLSPLWLIAVRADPHALHFLFTNIFVYLGLEIIKNKKKKFLPLLGLIAGLSIGNHMLSLFFLPSFLLLAAVYFKKKKELILKSFIFLSLGLLVYLIIPLIYQQKGAFTIDHDLALGKNLIRYLLGQDFLPQKSLKLSQDSLDNIFSFISAVNKHLTSAVLLTSIFGIILCFLKNKLVIVFLLLFSLLNAYFSSQYANAEIERYYIPNLIVFVLGFSLWFSFVIDFSQRHKARNKFKKAFPFLLTILISINIILLSTGNIYKNYNLIDQSKNYSAEKWARQAFNNLEPNSVILSWWSYSTPLWYMQKVEGLRKDVDIINTGYSDWEGRAIQFTDQRPVYFIEEIELKDRGLTIIQKGNIYKIEKKETTQ